MRVVVRRQGKAASVRIPAQVLAAARIGPDQPVDVREEDGRIVIEKLAADPVDLASLVAAITDENRHEATDFGRPQGKEAW